MEPNLSDKAINRLADGREYRAMSMEAVAESVTDRMLVEGYATTFDQPYVLYDGMIGDRHVRILEQVASTAFNGCDMSDVIFQYNHEGRVFARTKNNTMQLTVDPHGLKVVADLGGTDIGRQLYQEIKGGYTDKMSFGFTVAEDKRETVNDNENGLVIITRTILRIKKNYDVSAVSIPANDMTSISARRYADGVIDGIKAERLERARKQQKLRLLLEV